MGAKEERTIPVPIDNLDYMPLMFAGFTQVELLVCFVVFYIIDAVILTISSNILFGTLSFGFILAVLFAAGKTIWAANKAYRIKNGRPSYLMWVDLQKHIQNKGILGIKFSMGYVSNSKWHTGSKKER